jgi:hypothetical protein
MPTLDDATVRQKVENALLDLEDASKSVEIVLDWMGDVLEYHAIVGPALVDVPGDECEDVKVDVAIRHELAVIILAERMVDHQPAHQTMLFGYLESEFSLTLKSQVKRRQERDYTMDPASAILGNASLDSDIF